MWQRAGWWLAVGLLAGLVNGSATADDSPSAATFLGFVDPGSILNTNRSDSMTSIDRQDYYRFDLRAVANGSIVLTNLTADLDLELRNGSNAVLFRSLQLGPRQETLTIKDLPAGTYFVRVYNGSVRAESNYSLLISLTTNAACTSRLDFMGRSNASSNFSSVEIGSCAGGQEHWYQVTVTTRRRVQARLSGMGLDLDLELRDGNSTASNVLAASRVNGTGREELIRELPKGTYYFRVVKRPTKDPVAATTYTLLLNASGTVVP